MVSVQPESGRASRPRLPKSPSLLPPASSPRPGSVNTPSPLPPIPLPPLPLLLLLLPLPSDCSCPCPQALATFHDVLSSKPSPALPPKHCGSKGEEGGVCDAPGLGTEPCG